MGRPTIEELKLAQLTRIADALEKIAGCVKPRDEKKPEEGSEFWTCHLDSVSVEGSVTTYKGDE